MWEEEDGGLTHALTLWQLAPGSLDVGVRSVRDALSCDVWLESLAGIYKKCNSQEESFVEFYMSMWTSFSKGEE